MQAFCGVRVDAYENRIPIHCIKGHPFWVGQEGCVLTSNYHVEGETQRGGVMNPHPQWGLYQATLPFEESHRLGFAFVNRPAEIACHLFTVKVP